MGKKGQNRRPQGDPLWIRALALFLEPVVVAIERIGFPGTMLLLVFFFVERHANVHQKQEIVDLYVLGKDLSQSARLLVVGSLAAVVVVAQRVLHGRKITVMQQEIDRLAEWKTAHQQALSGSALHHSSRE